MKNQDENSKTLMSDFTTLMYQKGYRANYILTHPGTNHPGMTGMLSRCLDKFLTGYNLTEKTKDRFILETHPPANDAFSCSFHISYDEVKGFLIREMHIQDKNTQKKHTYNISSNQQIPGSNAIQGLFPKPKPWDHILKGKFRP